jgi:hypothetical protein
MGEAIAFITWKNGTRIPSLNCSLHLEYQEGYAVSINA